MTMNINNQQNKTKKKKKLILELLTQIIQIDLGIKPRQEIVLHLKRLKNLVH